MSDELIICTHDQPEEPARLIENYPCVIPGRWPAMAMSSDTMRFWCEMDEDFIIHSISPTSRLRHSVSGFIESCCVDDLFDGYSHFFHLDWQVSRALQMGIVYNQPFYVEACADYYTSHTPDGTEYDCNVQVEILHVTRLPDEEIARRWQEWLDRGTQK